MTSSAYGLPTAFEAKATYGSNGRVMGYNSEYDANVLVARSDGSPPAPVHTDSLSLLAFEYREQGHSCGHNLINVAGIAATLALSEALKELGVAGTVKLLGTPAEEGGGGKVRLLRAGAYDDLDACKYDSSGILDRLLGTCGP